MLWSIVFVVKNYVRLMCDMQCVREVCVDDWCTVWYEDAGPQLFSTSRLPQAIRPGYLKF